jgi:hypothetical protein
MDMVSFKRTGLTFLFGSDNGSGREAGPDSVGNIAPGPFAAYDSVGKNKTKIMK